MIGEARLSVPIGPSDHVQGPADAVLELVECGDYQCPYCGRAYPIIKRVQHKLNGVLKLAFRNFPLTQQHPDALNAAKAAEAAGLQGRFWPMHDMLFENQRSLDYDSLLRYAAELRLDEDRFAHDFGSSKVERKIFADIEGGIRSGVNGTPTFFINGIRYDGDWSYPSLIQVLQSVANLV